MSSPSPRPPDRPAVPRGTFGLGSILAIGFALLVVGGYTALATTGLELARPARDEIPASVRSSPGGYRSFHFWHSGYHGGK
jgi:hypothetical protein